jgi:TM2 domain-containing membrane protein YozV
VTKSYFFKKGAMQMGPYPLEKMRALARQGQLGRSYLVSADGGASWDTGSTFSEIFAGDPNEGGRAGDDERSGGGKGKATPSPSVDPEWYYCSDGGEQQGPVAESQMRHLIEVGAVGASHTVWTEALGDKWVAVSNVPKFAALLSVGTPPVTAGTPVTSGQEVISINTGAGPGVGGSVVGGPQAVFCRECGGRINRRAVVCPQCGVPTESAIERGPASSADAKNKTVAAVLAFCLGGLGAHHFYLGQIALGVLYLIFCWTFIPAIIGFIEAIVFLGMSDRAFDAKYNR